MSNKYTLNGYNKDNMARVLGRSLPISLKQSIEICNSIRNKSLNFAKQFLNDVANKKRAVPFRRFNKNMGHKKGMSSGRYPKNASTEILGLLNQAEANAQFKGLNTSNLIINHIKADKSATVNRFGRKRSRRAKRAHLEIVVGEKIVEKNNPSKSPAMQQTNKSKND
jgi:large subunit ribosomal protein L22